MTGTASEDEPPGRDECDPETACGAGFACIAGRCIELPSSDAGSPARPGDGGGVTPVPDASPAVDASTELPDGAVSDASLDGSSAADAALLEDAAPSDASEPPDASEPMDASVPADASELRDASVPTDASTPPDASVPLDAASTEPDGSTMASGGYGAPCWSDEDCGVERPVCLLELEDFGVMLSFPEGYCASSLSGECPEESVAWSFDGRYCMARCPPISCRDGYVCRDSPVALEDHTLCLPVSD